MEHQLILHFRRSEIAKHCVAFKELGHQDSTRAVLSDDFGHALMKVVLGIAAKLFHIAGFASVIEFFSRPGNELAYRFDHPVNKTQTQTPDEVDSCHHQSNIA